MHNSKNMKRVQEQFIKHIKGEMVKHLVDNISRKLETTFYAMPRTFSNLSLSVFNAA